MAEVFEEFVCERQDGKLLIQRPLNEGAKPRAWLLGGLDGRLSQDKLIVGVMRTGKPSLGEPQPLEPDPLSLPPLTRLRGEPSELFELGVRR